MRITWTLPCVVLALGFAAAAPAADAGDGHRHCAPCDAGPVYTSRGLVHPRAHSWRDPCHPSTRYVSPRYNRGARYYGHRCGHAHGSPWSVLRRYLPGYGASPEFRRAYVRSFFLRRYPFSQRPEDEALRLDTLLARAEHEPQAQAGLPPEARLHLGMARFFTADYAGARADFEAVLASAPKDARARYGTLLCSLCTSDWKGAAGGLDALARQDEIRRGDRLDAEGCFGDPTVFAAVAAGLEGHARYRIGDGDAWLVAAWTRAVRGEEEKARSYTRLARRWNASGAGLAALERVLGLRNAPEEDRPATDAPVPAPRPPGNVIARLAR